MILKTLKITAIALALSTAAVPALAETITFAFTDDDPNYIAMMEKLVDQFETENKDITVDFITAGYAQMMEQLPLQLSVGKGPDVAKITATDLLRYTADLRPYMKDPDCYAKLHGKSLDLIRTPGAADDKIGGYVASQTLNQPFVNVTLFEQAGVPLPAKGATLTEIVDASVKVAKTTGVEIPFTMDRSGHRFAGPAFSYGAHFLKDGQLLFPDDGAKRYIADLYKWTQSGAFPKEMWGAAGGTRYKNMGDEFASGNVVTYLAGNWMVNPFVTKIGDAFDWTAIDPPCGDAGCVPMPGSTFIVAFQHTKAPEAAAKLIEFLGSEKVQRNIAEQFLILPGAQIDNPQYKTDNANAKSSMEAFARNVGNVPEEARTIERTQGASAVYGSIVQRMSQLIVGELTLEETYAQLAADAAEANVEIAKYAAATK
jgi:alpha-1,4-digalacturonate transport system substrate-binding protein